MRLVAVTLARFRGYQHPTRLSIADLTAIVGRNDVGKSSILEALEIFFNNSIVAFEKEDLCVHAQDGPVEIACEFDKLPPSVLIDAQRSTSLDEEHLLNSLGYLEIVKRYDCTGAKYKETVFARAIHPTAPNAAELLQKKITELRTLATTLGAHVQDNRSSASLRSAIRSAVGDANLQPQEILIALDKEDAKQAWESLKKELPIFALFQSDRPSKDDDGEVQNPMKLAVAEAIKSVETELAAIRQRVEDQAMEVANRTLAKLQEMDPTLASELKPVFEKEPNYAAGFKLSIIGDNDIPVNKRGSGVRRLILLNFFRAEAERRQQTQHAPSIIYAIEEPESSQHPKNQRLLINALLQLSTIENVQVLLTTHVPGIASLLPQESLRLVRQGANVRPAVFEPNEDTLKEIADELGVLPDNRVQVLLYVEGPNDVNFLDRIGAILKLGRPEIPIPSTDPRIGIIITGGGNLKHWVNCRYLRNLQKPEVHIFDRDDRVNPRYQGQIDAVVQQGHTGLLTAKREAENYLHPDAIFEATNHRVTATDWDWADIPEVLARLVHGSDPAANPWDGLSEEKKGSKCGRAKERLNRDAAARMNTVRLQQMDPAGEIEGWFDAMLRHLTPLP
jgi:hypothetical protein